MIMRSVLALAACACAILSGCNAPPNPSFPLTTSEAGTALKEMRANPRPAQRPLVIIGGFGDPGIGSSNIKSKLEPCLQNPQIIRVDPWTASSFDDARQMVVDAVEKRFPSQDPAFTIEVDVVGNSMGGLVALYAVLPPEPGSTTSFRALRAARVFTLGSPLRGAEAAKIPALGGLIVDMRPGSEFLAKLDASNCCQLCELIPYTRSDDGFVGADNTAPRGKNPWWVPAEFFQSGHATTHDDKRILADIARRLRGEEPFTQGSPTPLPSEDDERAE